MTDTDEQQKQRRANVIKLRNTFHRDKYGDYEDTYAEFDAEWGVGDSDDDICDVCGEERQALIHTDKVLHEDDAADGLELHKFDQGGKPFPRYASVAEDETYGMIHLVDTMHDALRDQAGIPSNGEYLNVPAGIYDLDSTDEVQVPMHPVTLMLTPEMYRMLPNALEDAIYYRQSDDEDEDGENDNNQADKYRDILALIEHDNEEVT